jgi:SpoVK/Ycf46/Vps4 family AAA+-type ATPase
MCDIVSERVGKKVKKDDELNKTNSSTLQYSTFEEEAQEEQEEEEPKPNPKTQLSSYIEKMNKNKTNNNLSNLLNIIDGLNESSDRIIIVTSNHPEKLDKALIRSGRIDIKINFKKSSSSDMIKMLHHYWDNENTIIIPTEWSYKISPADIINDCRSSVSMEDSIELLNKRIMEIDLVR